MRVHVWANNLCHEEEEGEKQLYLKPEIFTLKIVMIILYYCVFFLTKNTFIGLKSI